MLSRCRWRTGTCRRWWRPAWITSWCPTWRMPNGRRKPRGSHYCPWNQTLPWVLRSAPALEAHQHKFLIPTLHFQLGPAQVKKGLAETMRRLGVTRRASDRAVDAAYTRAARVSGEAAGGRAPRAGDAGADRRAGPGAGRPRLQHLRPRRELRHPAQAAPPLRRQRDPAGFPGDRPGAGRTRTPTCSGSRAARFWKPRAWPPAVPTCTWSTSPISSAGPIPTSSTSPAKPPARRCWSCSSTGTATTPAT